MTAETYVIVGASLAGAKAADELRERGFDGSVVLIGSEPELPYERPPLSKDLLLGKSDREKVFVFDAEHYGSRNIELLTSTTVTAIDPASGTVSLADGGTRFFDKLLLTTGSHARAIDVPGADLPGIFYLRTLDESELLRAQFEKRQGGHLAVVGAGWIGSEVAACARQAGLEVTVIDSVNLPNERIFGPEIGQFYKDVHESHGVRFLLGNGVEAFEGSSAVGGVRTTSGSMVDCDLVVVGVGAAPRISLADDAGLEVGNGIHVDARLRTSAANVWAAGDVAAFEHPFYGTRIRVEHWANALNGGPAAARSMLGDDAPYDRIPYFFSDQYDVGMEYSGYATEWDEVVFRGSRDDGEFIAFWLAGGHVVAGMNVGVWDVNEHVQALIRSRTVVDVDALVDPDTPLESLVA